MRTILLSLTLTLAACGGIATPPEPEPCPTIPEAGAPETSPDASPVLLDAGAVETSTLDVAPCDAGPRYVSTGVDNSLLIFDRTTGITWYGRFLYGSAFVPAPTICDGLPTGVPMRRATVAEAMTILVFRPDGQVQWDDPFIWSNAIASQAADGCVNLPPFSVTAFNECQGDLINRLCVKQ